MLIWLASYPRSGNTLLRILLNRCFGIETFSLYDDRQDIGADPELQRVVGHRFHGMGEDEFREHARNSPDTYFAKTHALPQDDSKAIYIVRDGRAAIVSYDHYLRDIGKRQNSLSQVVKGATWGGSWSGHVEAWALANRKKTLVLRYEDIVAEPMQPLRKIADFLGLPSPHATSVDFEELHAAFPHFFRSGSNTANTAELAGNDLELFWSLHGETMARMGYVDPQRIPASAQHDTTNSSINTRSLAPRGAQTVSSTLDWTPPKKELNPMLSHVVIGDRLEIYRVSDEGGNRSFAHLGAMNFVKEGEDKPFMESLSSEEKKQVADIRNRALQEYRRKLKVDAEATIASLTGLAFCVQTGITPVSDEQDILLTLAWQKLRQAIKNASDGGSTRKAPAAKPKR